MVAVVRLCPARCCPRLCLDGLLGALAMLAVLSLAYTLAGGA